jgi:hypothetical protein
LLEQWNKAALKLPHDARRMHVVISRDAAHAGDAVLPPPGEPPRWPELAARGRLVAPIEATAVRYRTDRASVTL